MFPDLHNNPLTPDQSRVLALLADGQTMSAAAETVGVHRNTIRNWRESQPAFSTELACAIREQAQAWREEARNAVPQALQAMIAILNDPNASASLRLRAAGMVLKMADLPAASVAPRSEIVHNPAQPRPGTGVVQLPRPTLNFENLHNPAQPVRKAPEPSRNSQCPCGSGQKYKRCCAFAPPAAA